MLRLDLHVHSRASKDAKGTLQELAVVAKERGLDGFAVTDHNVLPDLEELRSVQEETGCLLIPGMEISSIEGHILAIGVRVDIPRGQSMQETIHAIHRAGGVAVPSHPLKVFSGAGPTVLASLAGVDAIEGRNGRDRKLVQENSMALAESLGLPTVGGTDAHWIHDIGTTYTMVDAEPTEEAVLNAIRAGKCSAAGGNLKRRSVYGRTLKQRLLRRKE